MRKICETCVRYFCWLLFTIETTKITNYRKNVQKSPNQNHRRCVTKSQNKRQVCDKFGDYFCSTYRNYNLPSLALGACSVVHLTDPSSSIGISMRYSLHRIIRSLFWGDEIVKQQRVTWITMNDLDTTAPVTTVERKQQQRLFPSLAEVPNSSCSQDKSPCALSATAMLRYTICTRVSETFTAG